MLPKYKATGVLPRRKTMACLSAAPWMEEPGVQMEVQTPGSGSLLDNRAVKSHTKGKISFLTPAGYQFCFFFFLPGSRGVFVI